MRRSIAFSVSSLARGIPATIDAPPPPVSLITLGRPVLGVTDGWELYGRARSLGSETAGVPGGVVSPDGSTGAILEASPEGAVRLYLVNLSSGNRRPVTMAMNGGGPTGTIVFSPDSRWLFAVTARGKIAVIDPRTAGVTDLDAPLPTLSQLAVKPASRD